MTHDVLIVGPLRCNCSIFGDEGSSEAIVIDPGGDLQAIRKKLEERALRVKAIVITHAHIDHVAAAAQLRAETGAPVYMNERDGALLKMLPMQADWIGVSVPETPAIDLNAKDGSKLELSGSEFHVLETPGHTEGSLCLWIPAEGKLVAGDTLFRRSIGRTDLPGGDGRRILQSIATVLMPLPEATVVIPGHGPATTIGEEREFNPFLQG